MNIESKLPLSRNENIVVQDYPDETLVYDLANHKAHCLNKTATAVWRRCDGKTTVREMASILHSEEALPADESIVWLALRQLEKARLLDVQTSKLNVPHSGRRDVLKLAGALGAAALAIPAITSIVAPTPALADTCLPSGSPCTVSNSVKCCSRLCSDALVCV